MSLPQPHSADFQRESVEQSQSMTVADRFWAGAELFDYACTISRSGIRRQYPDYSSEQLEVAWFGNPDPVDMKVYYPCGEEAFDDEETTKDAPARRDHREVA